VAVAEDTHSFKLEDFNKYLEVIKTKKLKKPVRSFSISLVNACLICKPVNDQDDMNILSSFVERVGREVQRAQSELSEMGDIPEEFLDPILNTMMNDPVILPSSGVILDRAVISRHLLSDATDPYNRQPLTTDQLKPATQLKIRIDKFKQDRANKHNK